MQDLEGAPPRAALAATPELDDESKERDDESKEETVLFESKEEMDDEERCHSYWDGGPFECDRWKGDGEFAQLWPGTFLVDKNVRFQRVEARRHKAKRSQTVKVHMYVHIPS